DHRSTASTPIAGGASRYATRVCANACRVPVMISPACRPITGGDRDTRVAFLVRAWWPRLGRADLAYNAAMSSLVGVIGDFDPLNRTHLATNEALGHCGLTFDWVATEVLDDALEDRLAPYRGLLIAPASPYRNMDGALSAIRFARERGLPLVGT